MKLPQNKVLLGRYVLPELCRLVKTCRIPQLSVAERGQGRERITPRRVEKTILELIYFLAAWNGIILCNSCAAVHPPTAQLQEPDLLSCIPTLATPELSLWAETPCYNVLPRIINIKNKVTYLDIQPNSMFSSLPAIFFWPYTSSSYLWKVFWLPCFWCLFAARDAEDIEYNLSDSCFCIKTPVSVANNERGTYLL